MRRVFIITALMLGVLLMGLTTGVMIQREGGSPPEVVLVIAQPDGRPAPQIYAIQRHDGREIWQNIVPQHIWPSTRGVSPDGAWLYVVMNRPPDRFNRTTIRLRLDGLQTEHLTWAVNPSYFFWSADQQWMVFQGLDIKTGASALFRANPVGQIVQNLTAHLHPTAYADPAYPPILSPDHDWLAFSALDFHHEVYRVDTATGEIQQLTRQPISTYLRGHVRNDSGDWLLVSLIDGAYRMRLDGTELTRLLPKADIVADIVYLWPEARLIMIQRDQAEDILYAVSMDDFKIKWSMPNAYLSLWQTNQPYRLVGLDRMYQVFPDGRLQKIENLLPGTKYHFSGDGRQIFFSHVESASATSPITDVLRSVNLEDGQLRTIYTADYLMNQLDWASDAGWFLIEHRQPDAPSIRRVWEDSGRVEILVSERRYEQFLGVGRLADWAFHPVGLIGLGGVLTVGGLIRRRRKTKS